MKLKGKNDKTAEAVKELLKKFYKKADFDFDEFKNFFVKIITVHQRCGDSCPHLRRFFAMIGFTTDRFKNRKELKPTKQKLNPFGMDP